MLAVVEVRAEQVMAPLLAEVELVQLVVALRLEGMVVPAEMVLQHLLQVLQ